MTDRMVELQQAGMGMMNGSTAAPMHNASSDNHQSQPMQNSSQSVMHRQSAAAAAATGTSTSHYKGGTERVYPLSPGERNGKNLSMYSSSNNADSMNMNAGQPNSNLMSSPINSKNGGAYPNSNVHNGASTNHQQTQQQPQQPQQQYSHLNPTPVYANPTANTAKPAQTVPVPKPNPTIIMNQEDEKMRKFLDLLSGRKASSSNGHNTNDKNQLSGPTVPHPLSRRILNRQGVNYMDENVSAIMSGAADRFLATVLQQSMICRDRRLQGEEMAKKEKRELNKLKRKRMYEMKARKRKRDALEKELEIAIKTPASSSNTNEKGKKNTTKKNTASSVTAKLINNVEKALEDDEGNDPINEEMDYYENYLNSNGNGDSTERTVGNDDNGDDQSIDNDDDGDSDDEDENKLTLQLRDVVRPLEAWGVSLTGKIGLSAQLTSDETLRKRKQMNADDDSNAEADGDEEGNEDDEDDDEISIASSKVKGNVKEKQKRATTPKTAKGSPKAKPRKASPTPQNTTDKNLTEITGASSGNTNTAKL